MISPIMKKARWACYEAVAISMIGLGFRVEGLWDITGCNSGVSLPRAWAT